MYAAFTSAFNWLTNNHFPFSYSWIGIFFFFCIFSPPCIFIRNGCWFLSSSVVFRLSVCRLIFFSFFPFVSLNCNFSYRNLSIVDILVLLPTMKNTTLNGKMWFHEKRWWIASERKKKKKIEKNTVKEIAHFLHGIRKLKIHKIGFRCNMDLLHLVLEPFSNSTEIKTCVFFSMFQRFSIALIWKGDTISVMVRVCRL